MARVVLPALFWLAVWQVVYLLIHKDLLVPSPTDTARAALSIITSGSGWRSIGVSVYRVAVAYVLGITLGVAFTLAAFTCKPVRHILSPALTAVRATPVASFIIIIMVLVSPSSVPIITGAIMVMPIVFSSLTQAVGGVDEQLLEMARVYGFGAFKTFSAIYVPSCVGAFIASAQASIGLCWKAMIAAEVLGTPRNAMGTQLFNAKIYLNTDEVFAWTIITILISKLFEVLLVFAGKQKGLREYV